MLAFHSFPAVLKTGFAIDMLGNFVSDIYARKV